MPGKQELPAYCFQKSDFQPEPDWCSADNDAYRRQCAEVDELTDSVVIELTDLTEVLETKCSIKVNFTDKMIVFQPSSGNELTVGQVNLRYCHVLTGDDVGHTIVISYWDGFDHTVQNVIASSENIEDCCKLMNSVRKLIFQNEQLAVDPARIKHFYPFVAGTIRFYQTSDLSTPVFSITDDNYQTMFLVVDEEAILVYEGNRVKKSPTVVMKFSKEQCPDSIERIYAHPRISLTEIETQQAKCFFTAVDETTAVYKKFSFYVQGRIEPKHQDVFDFQGTKFYEYMKLHPLEQYSENKPQFVSAASKKAAGRSADGATNITSEPVEGWAEFKRAPGGNGSAEATGWDQRTSWEGSQQKEMWPTDPATNPEMNSLVSRLQAVSDMKDVSEETQLMWITIEAELEDKIRQGLVPKSSIQSGGLDPNSSAHFTKCMDEIQEALFTERLDYALSHMQGCQQVFSTSACVAVVHWLHQHSDIERLRQIYVAGSK